MKSLDGMQVAVLAGGTSPEREVSLNSGATVAEALAQAGARVSRVDPQQPRWWSKIEAADCAFIALHGAGGEDGAMQGALESLGVPYTGSGVLASALAMDKLLTKRLWRDADLPVADCRTLDENTDWVEVIATLGKVFVKPATAGSSIGMRPAETAEQLAAAYAYAKPYSNVVLAERYIAGPEYTVAILGERALPAIRLQAAGEFYDYHAKYIAENTSYQCPAGLSAEDEAQLGALCLRAFAELQAAVWGRIDAMRDADGRFYLLELNTVPGMTSHSLVPMAARAAGLTLPALVSEIVLRSLSISRGGHA